MIVQNDKRNSEMIRTILPGGTIARAIDDMVSVVPKAMKT
jgi:hypothetical protein